MAAVCFVSPFTRCVGSAAVKENVVCINAYPSGAFVSLYVHLPVFSLFCVIRPFASDVRLKDVPVGSVMVNSAAATKQDSAPGEGKSKNRIRTVQQKGCGAGEYVGGHNIP